MQFRIDFNQNLEQDSRKRILFIYEEFLVFFSEKKELNENDIELAKKFLKYLNEHAEALNLKDQSEYRTILNRLQHEYPQLFP